jgi:hypothetical protein
MPNLSWVWARVTNARGSPILLGIGIPGGVRCEPGVPLQGATRFVASGAPLRTGSQWGFVMIAGLA